MMHLPVIPSFRLDGRKAFVTGAGRGIGAAAAVTLGGAGAHVTLAARSGDEVEALAAGIKANGGEALGLRLDVTDVEAAAQVIQATGPFDVLVNNAGTNRPSKFVETTLEDYDAVMELNVRASFFIAQAVTKSLIAAGRPGSIINISSQMGHVGGANRAVYCASKWAMEGFTRAMAIDLAANKIRVNTLCPTFVETPMTAPFLQNSTFREEVLTKIKLGRLATVEDLMGAVVFLASDASALMTGASLIIDGGWTAD